MGSSRAFLTPTPKASSVSSNANPAPATSAEVAVNHSGSAGRRHRSRIGSFSAKISEPDLLTHQAAVVPQAPLAYVFLGLSMTTRQTQTEA